MEVNVRKLSRRPLLVLASAFAVACVGALSVTPAGASKIPIAPKNAMLANEDQNR
jgi:hypothetical protein